MTDDIHPDHAGHPDDGAQGGSLLRLMTLVIGSAEIIAFTLYAHLMLQSDDPLGSSIGEAMILLLAVPVAALTLPGLLLAWLDRAPRSALSLVLAAAAVAAFLWVQA